MQGFKKKLIFLTLGIISPLSLQTPKVNAGSFGAEIFCTMRDGEMTMKVVGMQHIPISKNKKEDFSKSHLNKQPHKLLNP